MTPQSRTALGTVGLVVLMGSLSFAAVPFYSWFCKVTGFAGTTAVGTGEGVPVLDKTVTVRFDASVDRGMPWSFRPAQTHMSVRLGETNLAFFEAHNPTDHPIAGQASFNVVPDAAGGYFTKIECFCFTQQVLQPGETVQMPVSFYVDPAMLDDPEGKYVHEITLGYTFYQTDLPSEESTQAALGSAAAGGPLTADADASIE
ncbi:Cytochrome oxidase biogenesis protein Cox11-CtaG, copper delivery to Cox1 [Rubellimicrobium mesophilum DSM 19309]|uniref:Cytochrome c oxidase assembly protein CtaG n=1 Tax=Rubellimicrobium mesophilum DSM 19309 TaxID=442562 RepID=A0A017HUI7_9RHOB|nr:cytochrome c oxidase assembly protein [Rubellimicrobium mesophilum]EYD77828.1 Cytochrome oxidase biogenesis protein Cox11-CtaG, copper delivery to Cox1 [Rubellimicrobium mesophilum DSM 19309]